MIIKKFVPCIYLYHEHAVRNLTDTTIVDTDPVRLADYYCEHLSLIHISEPTRPY